MDFLKQKKIAIIADWLIDFGGAELVISHLLEMYPEADIYTSVCYMDHPMLEGRRVYTSWIAKIPFFNRRHKLAGLLRPWAFRSFDLSGYDLVICSSSAESKQVAMGKWRKKYQDGLTYMIPVGDIDALISGDQDTSLSGFRKNAPKVIVYCHTPTRYYWSHAKKYEDMLEFGILNPIVKAVFRLVKSWMQKIDLEAARNVDHFIANSRTTAERIEKYYGRKSVVIYPGVDTPALPKKKQEERGEYYFSIGRCIPYKRFDLLVDAFNTNGKKLILATATDTALFRELKAKSKPNIEWRFRISNEEKQGLMTHAKAFLFPPEEDFGLAPVEAMMCGTPVIAYGKGGATESVVDRETGIFFSPQTSEALNQVIEKSEKMEFNRETIRVHAEKFSKEEFQKHIREYVESIISIP